MTSTTLSRPPTAATHEPRTEQITLYGDFNCPWSYLAFRRAEVLIAGAVEIDWRPVEHLPGLPHGRPVARPAGLRDEIERVVGRLLPGEALPHEIPAFLPRTAPAIAACAEGYAAEVAAPVARALFEAYWLHGVDVGDSYVLRTLLTDQLRGSASPSRAVREWGAPVAVTGAPMSAEAYRLLQGWSDTWRRIGAGIVPVLQVPGGAEPIRGVAAVEWLADRITELGLPVEQPAAAAPRCWRAELPPIGWSSVDGGRWHRRFQRCGGNRPAARS